jgi:SOS response regulatory protein OraA/RecX
MKKNAHDFLFNEAIKYLGKYPATKKKIEQYLQKKIRNKKIYLKAIFPENVEKDDLIKNILFKLDELKIINESHYLETLFHYYKESLFSIRKIKNKLYLKGFDQKIIDEFFATQLQDDPDFEITILRRYIQKKKLESLDSSELKKKLYQQSFSESSIYKLLKK